MAAVRQTWREPLIPSFVPNDTTWLMMRDSALLPIVPELLVKNYGSSGLSVGKKEALIKQRGLFS
jgi:hypothetical protein